MLLDLLRPLLGFRAHLAHPSSRSVLQFGMVFVFPSSVGGPQRIALLTTLNFVAGDLNEERTAAPFPDEFVDVGNDVNRQDDMRSAAQILRHTHSVT